MFKILNNFGKKTWLFITGILFFLFSAYILNKNPFNNIGIFLLIFSLFLILVFFFFYSKSLNDQTYIFNYEDKKYFLLILVAIMLFLFAVFAYIKNWHNVFYLLSICSYICLFSLIKKIKAICKVSSESLKDEKVKNLLIKFLIVIMQERLALCQE